MSAAHDPTGIAQGGWREEGAGDKSALNEEMEAETGEYHHECIEIHMGYDAVCFVSHVERYMCIYCFFHPHPHTRLLSSLSLLSH